MDSTHYTPPPAPTTDPTTTIDLMQKQEEEIIIHSEIPTTVILPDELEIIDKKKLKETL